MLVEIRGGVEDQGPEFKKKSEAKATDRLFENRPSRGQEQEYSKPRTEGTVF